MNALHLHLAAEPSPLVEKTVVLLERVLRERGDIAVTRVASDRSAGLTLGLRPGLGSEGYAIEDSAAGGLRIVGQDERGLLYGVGRFLRECRFDRDTWTPCRWRGRSAPAMPLRGMYFATHFHNYYHNAPEAEVIRYIEELALWGCNTLQVWFDRHLYRGIQDPAAQAMLARLRVMLKAAAEVGMTPAIGVLANEGYDNSPEPLRADWTAGHDGYTRPPVGHYRRELCPHKPGAPERLLAEHREVFEAFSGAGLGLVVLWPYDQGGCTCTACAPWGVNGFLKTAEPAARLAKSMMRGLKTVLSTWNFDQFTTGEWEALPGRFEQRPDWLDYILIDTHDGAFPAQRVIPRAPGGLPVVTFPELSMWGNLPWGGFGANPRPAHWQAYWDAARPHIAGSLPYSEGIYEDLNKVILLQLEWDPARPVLDIVRDYARSCFGPEAVEDVAAATVDLERGFGHGTVLRQPDGDRFMYCFDHVGRPFDPNAPWQAVHQTGDPSRAEGCLERLNGAAGRLPTRATASWRWQVLWLRAAIDAEIRRTGGAPSDVLDGYFERLAVIYHVSEETLLCLCPPSVRNLQTAIAGALRRGHD